MKKYYILLFILLGTINLASAQKAGSIEYGLDFGLNSSYVQSGSNNTVQSDVIQGVNLGLSAEYYFSKFWGIKAKVIYDQKGWGNGYLTLGDQSYDHVDYQLNYITVPIMANWHFGYNSPFPYVSKIGHQKCNHRLKKRCTKYVFDHNCLAPLSHADFFQVTIDKILVSPVILLANDHLG